MLDRWQEFKTKKPTGIRRYRYDAESCHMDIQFSGSVWVYRYKEVPKSLFDEFQKTVHPARYVTKQIKGKYGHVLITEEHIAREDADRNLQEYGSVAPTMLDIRARCLANLGVERERTIA